MKIIHTEADRELRIDEARNRLLFAYNTMLEQNYDYRKVQPIKIFIIKALLHNINNCLK